MKTLRVAVPACIVVAAAFVLSMFCTERAVAHPLGNFTINHLSELSFRHGRVDVDYVLDMAEIPTFQTMRAQSASGHMTPAQLAAWADAQGRQTAAQLVLANGTAPVALAFDGATAQTRPGAGGLPTLYLRARYHATLPADAQGLRYSDGTFPGRLGWHDVVVAPATEPTHALTAYPSALIGSPRAVTAVRIAFDASGRPVATPDAQAEAAAGGGAGAPVTSALRSNQLSDMLAKGTSDWTFVLLTFVVAIALGALHALEPGHGKTLLAISLVGARATVKQAGILAGSLTVAHTIGVLALGLAIELFKGYFVPETVYPWITLLSGIVIAILGARAVERQLRLRRPFAHAHAHAHPAAHAHDHEHEHHPVDEALAPERAYALAHAHHDHGSGVHTHAHESHEHHDHGDGHATHEHHDHGIEHGHGAHAHTHDDLDAAHARAHAIPGTAPLKFGATVWAAMSGGVAPCPAALVVLLAAIALDQVTYGLLVIVAFSFGLAVTLTGLGIAVVRGAAWLGDRPLFTRITAYGPLVSGAVIATIGAIMVGQGFAAQGVATSPLVISGVTALAIAGYAFSHPFAHHHEARA